MTRQSARLRHAGLAVFLFVLLCAPSWCESAPPPGTGAKVLLVGLDGADWQIINPLMEAGRMPNMSRLRAEGAWCDLRSTNPMLSPLLWTSVATGKSPDKHGIIDFLVRDPRTGQQVPITSSLRKARALWNIYSDAGRSVDILGWWATWPAETINGLMVSDRFAYSLFGYASRPEDSVGLVHPPEALAGLQRLRTDESKITLEDLKQFAPFTAADKAASEKKLEGNRAQAYADPLNHLVRILATTRTYHAIALERLRNGGSDLLAVYYQGIDEVGHRFAQYIPPKLEWVDQAGFDKLQRVVIQFYIYQDQLLGELLQAAGPQTTVVVMSDHGFLSGSDRPDFPPDIELQAARWHRLYGILCIKGPDVRPGRMETASLYDITPTLLYMSGLPVATDLEGRPLLDALKPAFRDRFPVATVATYEKPAAPGDAQTGSVPEGAAQINQEILDRLRSLGYIAPTGIGTSPAPGVEVAPATVTNLLNTAALQIQKGEAAAAEASLRSILQRAPENVHALLMLGEALEAQARDEEALEQIRTGLNLTPEPTDQAVARYAVLAHKMARTQEAKEWLLRYTQLRPGRGEPWLGLGMVQQLAGDYKAAEASFLRALQLAPKSKAALTGLYNVYERGGRSQEVVARIEKAVSENPDSSAHHTLLGLVYTTEGRLPKAEAEMRRALDLEPDRDSALAGLAEILTRTGRLAEARSLLEKAVGRKPDLVEVRMSLGRVYGKMNRMGEATRQMAEAARLDPSNPSAQAQLGMLLVMQRQLPRAATHLERAVAMDPQLYEVRMHLAVVYHDMGRLEECERQLLAAVAQRPKDPEPHRLLAGLYQEMGRAQDSEKEQSLVKELSTPKPSGS